MSTKIGFDSATVEKDRLSFRREGVEARATAYSPLVLTRAALTMGVWGVLLTTAGALSQWIDLPWPGGFVALWVVFSVVGLFFQALCQMGEQPLNFWVWAGAIGAGWLFTLYVVYAGNHLLPEVAPVWLLLLGAAFAHTGRQVDARFYPLAALHVGLAIFLEMVGRGAIPMQFLSHNGPLVFGVATGASLLAGAWVARAMLARTR